MTLTKKSLVSLLIAGALFIGFMVGMSYFKNANNTYASVQVGSEYYATSTRNFTGNILATTTQFSQFCGNPTVNSLSRVTGTFGSVIITGAGASPFTFYDASSTASQMGVATSSLKVIASFPASTAAGTYTFDAKFSNGLLYVMEGTAGSGTATSTITCR